MYQKDGNSYFIVDGHVHIWDGSRVEPEEHPRQAVHRLLLRLPPNLSPEEVVWDYDTYTYYGGDRLMRDLFVDGYVDHAIFQADTAQ